MKKYNLIILLFVLFLIQANAQVGVISEIEERGPETNVFLEANNYDNYYGENDRGKGLLFPRVDLTTFKFTEVEENEDIPYASVYDGMIVYNVVEGKTGTGAYQSSTEVDVVPGFYYFFNPKGQEEFLENYDPIAAIALGVWTPLGGCCCDGTEATYSIIYKANNGSSDETIDPAGSSYATAPSNTFSPPAGYYFTGWNTEVDGSGTLYAASNTYGITASMILYAQWEELPPLVIDPDVVSPLVNTYVGAFWRNTQTGERLIRIPVSGYSAGDWSAVVVAGNFIKLDTQESPDRANIWDAAKTPGDAEAYQVSGSATSVNGYVSSGDNIYFRIGLTSVNPSPATPRYGTVLLTYGSNPVKYQYLYVRQGEANDYVFANGETAGYTYPAARDKAVKFSPYNLTASALTEGDDYTDIGVRGGSFTDYPTKAGALFQWINTVHPRRAYHPTKNGQIDRTYPTGLLWNAATYETCPTGYRRPNDGATNALIAAENAVPANSEFRQSLWLNPQSYNNTNNSENAIYGYYADGYFDRRAVESGAVGNPNTLYSAVNAMSKDVAYRGTLFFNPANNKSLFFPAAGNRYQDEFGNYELDFTGYIGHYWSSSSRDTEYLQSWGLSVSPSSRHMASLNRINARSVRCVVE